MDRLPNPEREWRILKETILIEILNIKSAMKEKINPLYINTKGIRKLIDRVSGNVEDAVNKATDPDNLLSLLDKIQLRGYYIDHDIRFIEQIKSFVQNLKGKYRI